MSQVVLPIKDAPSPVAGTRLAWLTPSRCRTILVLTLGAIVLAHIAFLHLDCPLDLAEDEAYYWDWSRQLDYGYYSKGPLTAWLIRGSCALLGDTMPAVRLPAILLRAGVTAAAYWLTRRLLGSRRLALGAALLTYAVPLLLPAGMVMTTDPPFLLFWAVVCCLTVKGTLDRAGWAWPALGAVAGLGFLTKFSMPVCVIGLVAFLHLARVDGRWRKLATVLAAFLPFMVPMILWNSQHGWITFRHVGEDVGVIAGEFSFGNLAAFWIGQLGVIGPGLFILLLAAVIWGLRASIARATPARERWAYILLLSFGLPVFIGVILTCFRQHPSASWPMAAYFTLTILTAAFIARLLNDPARPQLWRCVVYPSLLVNIALVLLAHRTDLLYPLLLRLDHAVPSLHLSIKTDPTHRLHGWKAVGQQASEQLRLLRPGAIIMAGDYQIAAELAFYMPGQPKTFCIGSYFADSSQREPFSQYDLWPDRRLDPVSAAEHGLIGRDALYLGPMTADLRRAFDQVQQLPDLMVEEHGLMVRRVQAWRCQGFRGIPWPGWRGRYNK
jgi:hypothetical protein